MKLLILLSLGCVVAVSSASGGSYLHQDYARGGSGVRAGEYRNQGSQSYYDQAENHQRTKQVVERESSSRVNRGGSRQGSLSTGSFGAHDTYGRGSLNRRRNQQYGPRYL